MAVVFHALFYVKSWIRFFWKEAISQEVILQRILLIQKCLSIGSHDFAFSHHVLVTNGDGWKEELFISLKIFADDDFPALEFAIVISKLDGEKNNTQRYQYYPDDLSY